MTSAFNTPFTLINRFELLKLTCKTRELLKIKSLQPELHMDYTYSAFENTGFIQNIFLKMKSKSYKCRTVEEW